MALSTIWIYYTIQGHCRDHRDHYTEVGEKWLLSSYAFELHSLLNECHVAPISFKSFISNILIQNLSAKPRNDDIKPTKGMVEPASYPSHAYLYVRMQWKVSVFGRTFRRRCPLLFYVISTRNEQKRQYNTEKRPFSGFRYFLSVLRICWVATNGLIDVLRCYQVALPLLHIISMPATNCPSSLSMFLSFSPPLDARAFWKGPRGRSSRRHSQHLRAFNGPKTFHDAFVNTR